MFSHSYTGYTIENHHPLKQKLTVCTDIRVLCGFPSSGGGESSIDCYHFMFFRGFGHELHRAGTYKVKAASIDG